MKEYVIPASQIVTGYRRTERVRNETVYPNEDVTYTSWQYDYHTRYDDSSNRIKLENSSSRKFLYTLLADGADVYEIKEDYDRYRIDMTFDVSDVPSNRIQSVALRARLTGKNDKTPRGYYISSVGDSGGIFNSQHPHFFPFTLLGNCNLGTPDVMPYTHDTVLSGLSATGWYTLWNDNNTDYAYNELLAFSMVNFFLVIQTDEASGSTYTVTYNKGTYGTGTNTTDTKTEDVALKLLGAIFTRTDYTQTGWSTNADGSTKDYDLNGNYTGNANITLYPYWTRGHVATGNVLFIMTENGLQAII